MSVPDAIRMTRLADASYFLGGSSKGHVANFSPDGRRFTVVLKRGDLEHNRNTYSVFLFETGRAFESASPRLLFTMSSSTNGDAIKDVNWLADNDTLAFIGFSAPGPSQIYLFNINTNRLRKLTHHPTNIVSYDIGKDGETLIFAADPPLRKVLGALSTRRNGIRITTQGLHEVLEGDARTFRPTETEGEELFVQTHGDTARRIPLDDFLYAIPDSLSLSPNGRYGLIKVWVRKIPDNWVEYEDKVVENAVRNHKEGFGSRLRRYMLLDTFRRAIEPLLNAPTEAHKDAIAWAPDGQSLVLSGTYLPLNVDSPNERDARKKNTFVVEIKLPSREVVTITQKDLRVTKWDYRAHRIVLESGYSWRELPAAAFTKSKSGGWEEVAVQLSDTATSDKPLDITLEEDMNTPPKIFASDFKTKRNAMIFDPNPQFASLRFGEVKAVSWKATGDGHEVLGGLYLPPDYITGKRYPLVIQTHGWDQHRFWIDGPWSGAFAAQPLAGRDIIVLQVGTSKDHDGDVKSMNTPTEGPRAMAGYEGAVDYLDSTGLIDRGKVGIVGFSRTVYTVDYTLTHSAYHFSAATLADGVDGGYFQYVAFSNSFPNISAEFEQLNGGLPIGTALRNWMTNSPSFNLDKVNAPVRIEAYGPASLLGGWEWFSGLSRFKKPVDYIYLRDAAHLVVTPWDRLVSQQGDVDWFTFWLKGEEDPDPAKVEQYTRWRELRKLHQQNEKNSPAPTSN